MALRNAFGDLASDDSLKKVHTAQTDGSQKAKLVPAAAGGAKVYRNIGLGSNGVNVKSSAGQVYGWYLFNNTVSARFLKLYDKGHHPSVGHDTPVMTIPIPAAGGANVNFSTGIAFVNGIGVAATTGIADNDTGAPAAGDVVVNLIYF